MYIMIFSIIFNNFALIPNPCLVFKPKSILHGTPPPLFFFNKAGCWGEGIIHIAYLSHSQYFSAYGLNHLNNCIHLTLGRFHSGVILLLYNDDHGLFRVHITINSMLLKNLMSVNVFPSTKFNINFPFIYLGFVNYSYLI